MSEFEYLAVFISIIFGLGLTRILTGLIRSLYSGDFDQTRFVFAAYLFYGMLINWWTGFSWQSQQSWTFELYLVIILWSVAHYLAAITLYPPRVESGDQRAPYRINWFLWSLNGIVAADILQTAVQGSVFSPWYYLPFSLHIFALTVLAIIVNRPRLYRWIAWYFLLVVIVWSLVVRRFLL